MFPAVVNINPWLQEILYGALSILAITTFPEGVAGLVKRLDFSSRRVPAADAGRTEPVAPPDVEGESQSRQPVTASLDDAASADAEVIVACRGISFSYGMGPKVLRNVDLAVRRGHIHGLIGPNGSGKTTLANIIAGRLRPQAGATLVKGKPVDGLPPSARAWLGLRRTFQAAQLVRELTASRNVLVGLFDRVPGIVRRAPLWPLLPSGRRDGAAMLARAKQELVSVGAGNWTERQVRDIPHGIEQLTQLASVTVAEPDVIILDEPATGLSMSEVDHLAKVLARFKAKGVTMIIIEHQTRFLFPLCDRVTVLNAGEVILTGSADEVRADRMVRQVYLGE
jgi:branched-chain amino acid transport system permease protein